MIGKRIKQRLVLGALLLLALCSGGCAASNHASRDLPQPAPHINFIMLDGKVVSLDHYRGRNVVIAFWATTCPYSSRRIEALNELAREQVLNSNLVFLAVSVDKAENLKALLNRIKDRDLTALQHVFSGNDVYDSAYIALSVDKLPSIFLVDSSGVIVEEGSDIHVADKALR